MIYALSDTHLSFSSNKPMSIFGEIWEHHAEKIAHNCAAMLQPTDILLLPGDLSWALKLAEARKDLTFLDALPGRKILLRGNHDYWWSTRTKMQRYCREWGLKTLFFLDRNAFLLRRNKTASAYEILHAGRNETAENGGRQADTQAIWQQEPSLQEQPEFIGIVGTKGYLLPFEQQNEHDRILAVREYERLLYSLRQLEDLLLLNGIKKSEVKLLCLTHYPPLLKNRGSSIYSSLYEKLQAEYRTVQAVYGHLHGLGIREAFEGRYNSVDYYLVSADARAFSPQALL